jgi:hypothetical protein
VQDVVDGLAFMPHDPRLSLHGHDFKGAHRAKIAEATVGNRADTA